MQSEFERCGLDADAGIGQTAGHAQRHGDVGFLSESAVAGQIAGIQWNARA